MKNRIISFCLMLVMLFSCLSLQIFAAEGNSTESSVDTSGTATSDVTEEKIAEYFKEYGSLHQGGGYNLTAAELAQKVSAQNIILNEEFAKWDTYDNSVPASPAVSIPGSNKLTLVNKPAFERVTPGEADGNYYLKWGDYSQPVATKADGSHFTNLKKDSATGKYLDTDLQALVDAGQVIISDGVVYLKKDNQGEYVQYSFGKNLTPDNAATHEYRGATYTISFDLLPTSGKTALGNFENASNAKNGFGVVTARYGFKILQSGKLQLVDGAAGDYVSTSHTLVGGEWVQLAITHVPKENTVYYYLNGELIFTAQALSDTYNTTLTATDSKGNSVEINGATDFTFHRYRFGQSGYGFAMDDLRIYYGENVEIATPPHNFTYSHTHDIESNKNLLVATCQDEGCNVVEVLEADLCNKNGAHGLSVEDVSAILEAAEVRESALAPFTGGNIGKLNFTSGTYKENGAAVIDWVIVTSKKDASGNECLLWQRPVAKNPANAKVFTEAEVAQLSETAQALITFENGVPYYTGAVTGEYISYDFEDAQKAYVKDIIVNEPDNPILGGTYTITFDFTYYGGKYSPIQLRSYTKAEFENYDIHPITIRNGQLYSVLEGTSTQVPGVTIPVGQTIQITFMHMPRGFDGKRDVVNGYSAGDDDTYSIFIDGKCVATRKYLPAETYAEWDYTVGEATTKVSPSSDFTVKMIRFGQIAADNAHTSNLFAIDNLKIYRAATVECAHSVSDKLDTCDWCGHKFDLQRCDFCQGSALSETVSLVGQSATIGDVIEFNAFLKLLKDPALYGEETIVLDTTANGGTRKIECKLSDLAMIESGDAKGLYKVSLPLRSIDMTRSITVSVVGADDNTASCTASMNDYLDLLMESVKSYYIRQLVKTMKNYGACAQLYFEGKNGNPEDLGALPNENLAAIDKNRLTYVDTNTLLPYKASIEGSAVEISSFKLVLDSATELRILFRDGEGVTAKENGRVLTKHASEIDGYSYVSLVDPSPATFKDNHTVVFSNGEGETMLNVSVYSVLYLMHKGSDAELATLASSMYLFGKAAYEYAYYYIQDNEQEKQEWDEDGVLKLLCIGNSFSVDAMEWIGEIAADLGYTEVVFGNLYIGGCYIDKHITQFEDNLTNYTYYLEVGTSSEGLKKTTSAGYIGADAILSENWDFISLQQGSARSFTIDEYKNLPVLIDHVTSLCPSATLVWHQTWAYEENYANETKNITQAQMYEGILNCVQNAVMTQEEIELLIPSGTAIQNARTSYLGDTMNRDGYHLDKGIGRYIAALTFFAALTGADISKLEWAPTNIGSDVRDVDAAARAVAIESVINALKNPYEVTQSQYTEKP